MKEIKIIDKESSDFDEIKKLLVFVQKIVSFNEIKQVKKIYEIRNSEEKQMIQIEFDADTPIVITFVYDGMDTEYFEEFNITFKNEKEEK